MDPHREVTGGIPVGPFTLDAVIGQGGMARVWRARHTRRAVPVAVKVMSGRWTRDVDSRAFFREEVHAVAGLDHPGIVVVYDHGEVDAAAEKASGGRLRAGEPYLAMELARSTLREVKVADWPRARSVLRAVLEALGHAHAHGVIHRDVKGSNVLLFDGAADVTVKLADFGLAFMLDRQGQWSGMDHVSGTPWFMAPEQLQGRWRDYGPWTDLYALGCLAYEMVSGRPPFPPVPARAGRQPPPLAPVVPVPPGLESWLARLLQGDPQDRFQRAADAAHALAALPGPDDVSLAPLDWRAEPATVVGVAEADTAPRLEAVEGAPGDDPAGRVPPCPRVAPPMRPDWRPAQAAARRVPHLPGAGLGLFGLRTVPLVGRTAERDALWGALRAVDASRQAHVLLLDGAPGHGKTRLANWVADRAHELGVANVLKAYHGSLPGPGDGLPRMLSRFLRCIGLEREELEARAEGLLRSHGVRNPAEWKGLASVMAPAAMVDPAGAAPQSPPERHGLVLRFLRRLCRKRPLVLVFDDVQWGADSLAFLETAMQEDATVPLRALVLLTTNTEALAERPRESAALERILAHPRALRLSVPPLPAPEHAELVGEILDLDGDLARRVEERTEGNPLFAVHLVGDWVQRGVLREGPEGFRLASGVAVPQDVQQVWADRLASIVERQGPAAALGLETGAALGQYVEHDEWEAACRAAGGAATGALLDELVAGRLGRRVEGGWAFAHGLLRTVLERTSRDARRWAAINAACAAMLRERYGPGRRGAAERIGRHLLEAGQPHDALEPLLQGAREKRESSEYESAHALLALRERALEAAGAGAGDPRWGEGWVLRARVALHEGRLGEVARWAETAEREGARQDWPVVQSEALRLLGDAARRRGHLRRASDLYTRGVSLRPGANPHGSAASLWGLADVARQQGDTRRAVELLGSSRALYDSIGDAHGLADYWIGAGDVAWQERRYDEAEAHYQAALAAFDALGNRYGVARAWNGLGEVARARALWDAAEERYRRALEILKLIRSAEAVFPRLNLGLVFLGQGRPVDALRWLLAARGEARRLEWRALLVPAELALLSGWASHDDWSAWEESLDAAAGILRAQPFLEPDVTWAARQAGDAAVARGQRGRALGAYEIAIRQAEGLGLGDEATALAETIARL
jgi:eukaryotic-like serine/threonine-protein kinase